jgi:4-aminobutyrate aminotransferase-like enzyme
MIPKEIPGPKSRALRTREDAHLAPGTQNYALLAGIAVDYARGVTVTDVDGNTFLDFIGGIGVAAVGHSHPRVVEAITRQAGRAMIGSFTSEARVELAERLAAHAPAGRHRLQLYSSGAEAVESALRLAKSHTGKRELAGFAGGFHGKTAGVIGVGGAAQAHAVEPPPPGTHRLPYADCYRCPVGATYPSCGIACAEKAREMLRPARGKLAAIVIEPMQGTAGNIVPPHQFLDAVASIAKEHDALLVADEMLTGLGRTGRYWGIDWSGIAPDIITIGKAIGAGYPLSGILTSDEIAAAKPWSNPSGSSSSYGGNPLAAAAGAAVLAVLDDEALVARAHRMGELLLTALRPFVERYPFVGHVGGSGLFIGIELVRDKSTKEPLPRTVTEDIFRRCLRRGLLTMAYAASVRLQPPLILDEDTALAAVEILRAVFDEIS